MLGNGDGTFQSQVTYPLDTPLQVPSQFVAADVTGDGLQDIVTVNVPNLSMTNATPVYSLGTFAGNGDGTYQVPFQYNVTLNSIGIADFNGNGVPDFAVPNSGDYMVDIFSSGLHEDIPLTAIVYGNSYQQVMATYSGDQNYGPSTSNPVEVNGTGGNPPTPTFTLAAKPSSISIAAGQTGTATLTVTPQNGFTSAVQFVCSGLPANSSCSFSPSSVTPTNGAVMTSLTLATNVQAAVNHVPTNRFHDTFWSLAFLVGVGSLAGLRFGKEGVTVSSATRLWRMWAFCGAALSLAASISLGCGGSKADGTMSTTPAGTNTVTVTAVSSGASATTAAVSLTISITK